MTSRTVALGFLSLFAVGARSMPNQLYPASNQQRWYSNGSPFIVLDSTAAVVQSDGNLVVVDLAANPLWNSATTGHSCANSNCFLQWQSDGNLVLYEVENGTPTAYWSTGTTQTSSHAAAASLLFQDSAPYISLYDGSNKALWETEGSTGIYSYPPPAPTYRPDPPNPVPPPAPNPCLGGGCMVCIAEECGSGGDSGPTGGDGGTNCKREAFVYSGSILTRALQRAGVVEVQKRCMPDQGDD